MTKQTVKCSICKKKPTPDCSWKQGRCLHLPPILKGTTVNQPDPRLHQAISFIKSGFRLGACVCLAYYELQAAAILLAIAELLGIGEELV